VEGGTVFLRCPRLGREVIPRMHTAHRFDNNSNLRMYRFLNEVARQHLRGGPSWSWGGLDRLPFLPRVTLGRAILALARWRVKREDLYPNTESEVDRLQAVEAFRRRGCLPRFVVLAQNDMRLPIDLDNVMSVRGLVRQAQPWEYVEFEELFPAPQEAWATGPEGAYAAEWIVPFRSEPIESTHPLPALRRIRRERGSFPPGSEWVYAKLYAPVPVQNEILQSHIHSLVRDLERAALVDRWFFIRYHDPHTHLRLRFHAVPDGDSELLRLVETRMAALVDGGACWRLQFDTYEREIERYGGDDGIVAAEMAFHHDSEAVLELLREQWEGGPDRHWLLAVAGVDSLLTSLNFDEVRKSKFMRGRRDSFREEFRTSATEIRCAGDLFRKVRGDVLAILRKTRQGRLKSLHRRSGAIQRIFAGRGIPDQFAADLCHLHCNRLLRSTQRMQELVIYDLMNRAYDAIRHGSIEDAE
jgi:thiopeptide-type bacteriocin biosynthesis protein